MAPPREVIKCNTSDNHDYELLTGLVYSIAASGRMVVEGILRQTPFLIAELLCTCSLFRLSRDRSL